MEKYNTKIYITILMTIMLFSIVSASSISLSPSSLSISGYPGDSINKSITITTDGDYAVYLNYTSNSSSITMNYTSPLIVEGSKSINVTFIFAGDIEPGTYNIDLTASTEYATVTTTTTTTNYGGGGFVYVYPNGSFSYKKPTLASLNNIIVGNDSDEHGCKGSAGYSWCADKSKCIRLWEENCTTLDILESPVNEQTKGFFISIRDFFVGIWKWIFG